MVVATATIIVLWWLVRRGRLAGSTKKQDGPRGAAARLPLAPSQAGLKITPDAEPVARVAHLSKRGK